MYAVHASDNISKKEPSGKKLDWHEAQLELERCPLT